MQFEPLIYSSPLGAFELTSDVHAYLWKRRQTGWLSKEAGGQLFGIFDEAGVKVLRATGPRNSDRRGRFHFWPQRKVEQHEINEMFKSGLHYIGDWHTHPQPSPSPSSTDFQKLQEIFRASKHELRALLMVVVGTHPFPAGLWCGLVSDNKIVHLTTE